MVFSSSDTLVFFGATGDLAYKQSMGWPNRAATPMPEWCLKKPSVGAWPPRRG
jgi:hypothetical protein